MTTAVASPLSNWIAAPYAGPGRNIRRSAYIASGIMIPGAFVTAWTLIALGAINPMPADKYVSASLLVGYWMALFAFVDNPGESRTRTQKWHEFILVWLITSGLAQVVAFLLTLRAFLLSFVFCALELSPVL